MLLFSGHGEFETGQFNAALTLEGLDKGMVERKDVELPPSHLFLRNPKIGASLWQWATGLERSLYLTFSPNIEQWLIKIKSSQAKKNLQYFRILQKVEYNAIPSSLPSEYKKGFGNLNNFYLGLVWTEYTAWPTVEWIKDTGEIRFIIVNEATLSLGSYSSQIHSLRYVYYIILQQVQARFRNRQFVTYIHLTTRQFQTGLDD